MAKNRGVVKGANTTPNYNSGKMARQQAQRAARDAVYHGKQAAKLQQDANGMTEPEMMAYIFNEIAKGMKTDAYRRERRAVKGLHGIYREQRRDQYDQRALNAENFTQFVSKKASERALNVLRKARRKHGEKRARYVKKQLAQIVEDFNNPKYASRLEQEFLRTDPDWQAYKDRVADRKDRAHGFLHDQNAANPGPGVGLLAGLIAGSLITGALVYFFMPKEKSKDCDPCPECPKDLAQKNFNHHDGVLYMDGEPLTKEYVIGKLNATDIFTSEQMKKAEGAIKDGMAQKNFGFDFQEDGSVKVTLVTESGSGKVMLYNNISTAQVHEKVLHSMLAEGQEYTYLPLIDEGAKEAVFPIHSSVKTTVKNAASLGTDSFNALKVTYNADGTMDADLGHYSAEKGFTKSLDITEDQAKNALYTLADLDPDADQPVDDLFDHMSENALRQMSQDYKVLKGDVDTFLSDYGFETIANASSFMEDLGTFLQNNSAENLTGLQEKIDYLEGINASWNALMDKYGIENKSLADLYQVVDDWWAMVNATDAFLEEYGQLDLDGVRTLITEAEQNQSIWQRIMQKFNLSAEDDLYNMVDWLQENKTKFLNILEKYGLETEQDVYDMVQGFEDEIAALKAEMKERTSAMTVENITADGNSTAVWDYMMKAADRDEYDVYRLDLTDEVQLEVANQTFGKAVVERWLADGIVTAEIIDGEDSGDDAAAVGLKSTDHLEYVEAVVDSTWDAAKEGLEPYLIDEY